LQYGNTNNFPFPIGILIQRPSFTAFPYLYDNPTITAFAQAGTLFFKPVGIDIRCIMPETPSILKAA